ncbi:ABC transporter permease [Taklimakanibacter lacteus]|uniref:ABC transporter permease n=1 Tax=Taklimakanibacter lacteus TaxID=2268456 RepID=UPI000E66A589
MAFRDLPKIIVTLAVLAGLTLFIAYPIGAMLVESFVIRGSLSLPRLKAVTEEALAELPPDESARIMRQWTDAATSAERVDATAAAFTLADLAVSWDRKAAYSEQAEATARALAALPAPEREKVTAEIPIAHVMLHKRIPLAFKVRDRIGQARFDQLRSGADDRYGLDNFLAVFHDRHLIGASLNSLTLAAATTPLTVMLALLLAYAINCGGLRAPAATRAILLTPLVTPPVLIATAILMLFGRRGLVTHNFLDQTLGLIDADQTNAYGFIGTVLAQTLSALPASLIILDNVMRRQSGRVDEAAAMLGASHAAIFLHVTLPLAWPGVKRAVALVFIISLTDFANPSLLWQDVPVLAEVIYDQITAYQNTPLAAALCCWLLLPPLLLYLGLERIGRRKAYATGEAGSASELAMPQAWRLALGTLAAATCGFVLIIYGTMALGAVTRVWGADWSFTLGYFTSAGVDVGLAGSGYGSSDRGLDTIWSSLAIAGTAAPIGGLLGIVIAFVVERLKPPGANLIVFLALIPAILPGIIFGIGYIIAFNVPFGIKSLSLTGTSAILIINILFANLFVGVLAARAALQRLNPAVDEAAESLGAGLTRRFVHVTLPMLRPALLLGTLYVFVDGLTTLSSVIFLVSGDHKLASVTIFNHATSGDFGYAGAKSVILLAIALTAMGLIRLIDQPAGARWTLRWPRGASIAATGLANGKTLP